MSRPNTTLSHGGRPSQTPRRTRTGSPGRVPGRRRKALTLTATGIGLSIMLSGCSAQWASMSPSLAVKKSTAQTVSSTATATPSATPSSTSTATTADPFAGGELADGSVEHSQQAGDAELVVRYWIDGTSDDVHLSAELKGADRKHTVKVTQFAATLVAADGTQTALADDQGEFVLTPPYSYGSVLALPTTTATTATTAATIQVRFDLLLETAPGSGSFYRQTVLDTVELSSGDTSASEGASQ
ncbi:hypothetical protein KIH74_29425 [Kineosporia sp. J2-2]|uniref:Lipoprotein n=1 Tax=Kineosporia corallincola TaxID=2835133 RepID=A0ABS5TPS3_9ACTN|nr:hypothetical protein [Kineosporia corallincola]MBT0773101.1 hypothetical protein [Kineosporia corallincola]